MDAVLQTWDVQKLCFTAYTVYIILLNIPINIIVKKNLYAMYMYFINTCIQSGLELYYKLK